MDTNRRQLLRWFGKGSVVAAFLGQIGAAARAFFPNVLYEPPSSFKLDSPIDYPQGYTFDSEHRLFVIRQANRFHVISAICTHLGCTVQYRSDLREIWCACHNGTYDLNGRNISGPPPRPLDVFDVHVRGDEIVVNRKREA